MRYERGFGSIQRIGTWAIVMLLARTLPARADVGDIEVPELVLEVGDSAANGDNEDALDLANVVQSAAKGVTTVQEAPAIVTVIPDDEIRDRQIQNLHQLVGTVPGWQTVDALNSYFPMPMVRGQVQALQFLHDGLSLFDPFANTPSTGRQMPIELVKRVEMITGPGGVLWGSNSLVGIMNIITKDAEDLEGVEVGGGLGDGSGDRRMARAYVMAGSSKLLGGVLKLFAHGSVDSYQGAELAMPQLFFHSPLPQPNSSNTYGPLTASDQPRSMIVNLLAKVTYGKWQLRVQAPFGDNQRPLGISGNPQRSELPEDSRCSDTGTVDPACTDNLRASRSTAWRQLDRYAVLEYHDRFAHDRAEIGLRGYIQQFVRGVAPLAVYTPTDLIQGGLVFESQMTSYRSGGAVDGGVELAKSFRILYGAEAFREWGPGSTASFAAPYNLTRLPLLCPRTFDPQAMSLVPVAHCPLAFAYDASRSVFGAYLSPQWRPSKRLIIDAGARVQLAPQQLGTLGYDPTLTTAATIVWSPVKNWHVKLNYAQGFRPPVFNNTSSNGEAVQIPGNPDLKAETSNAVQAELNARVFKGERSIRELSFRLDGSFTRIDNLIQIQHGYNNSGTRAIASAELLAKLYVRGGHRLELAYTYLQVDSADRGIIRSIPEHTFNLATVFQLLPGTLTGTTNLRVTGAAEDPNRLVEYRDLRLNADGTPMSVSVEPTDLTLDRMPPIADLSLGLQWTPSPKLAVRATVYNALAQHAYNPDVFFDYEPHLEYLPNPAAGIRAYISAMYQY